MEHCAGGVINLPQVFLRGWKGHFLLVKGSIG